MIWANIVGGFDASLQGAQGQYLLSHANPNLMNAMLVNNALLELPAIRSDALIFGGGVESMRFIKSKSYDSGGQGYMAFVVVNGAAFYVVRSERLKMLKYACFFRNEKECFDLVAKLRSVESLNLGARVSVEVLVSEPIFTVSATAKMRAYAELRAATTNKFKADRVLSDFSVAALTAVPAAYFTAAYEHAIAWSLAAGARHAAAVAAYQALGGFVV
jgi:hypothetical protein